MQSALELTVDRIHKESKPSFLPDEVPRDVLLRLHLYHSKELFLAAFHRANQHPAQYASLQLFQTSLGILFNVGTTWLQLPKPYATSKFNTNGNIQHYSPLHTTGPTSQCPP